MAVTIRLRRMGRKNRDFFRVAVMDSRVKRDGRVIEEIGFYDPVEKDDAKSLKVDVDRAKYWLGVGAQFSATTGYLLKRVGLDVKIPEGSRKPAIKTKKKDAKK